MNFLLNSQRLTLNKSVSNSFRGIIRNNATNSGTTTATTSGTTTATTATANSAPNPPKEKLLTRFGNYLKQIYTDYKEVAKDSVKYCDKHPFKALGYGLFMTSMVIFYKRNPDKINYDEKRKQYANDMIMCGSTYSKRSEWYLNELNKMENAGIIQYRSCIIFSLIMTTKFNQSTSIYEKQCSQLHSPSKYNIFNMPNAILKFISRIVDIGFCGDWIFLSKRMENYDVDELELELEKRILRILLKYSFLPS